jgi:hypothetical protein
MRNLSANKLFQRRFNDGVGSERAIGSERLELPVTGSIQKKFER